MNYELSSKQKFILKQNLDKFKEYYNIDSIDELDNIRNFDKSFIISTDYYNKILNKINSLFNINLKKLNFDYLGYDIKDKKQKYYNITEILDNIKFNNTTGENGFLLSNFDFKNILNNQDLFYHFGSPSCREKFIDNKNLFRKMILSSLDVIVYCKENNKKLIFASSMGAKEFNIDIQSETDEILHNKYSVGNIVNNYDYSDILKTLPVSDNLQDLYNTYKKIIEDLIIQNLDNYIILRIPRVYDKKSKKGLLNPNNTDFDLEKYLDFITLNDFKKETEYIINSNYNGIYEYKCIQTKKIKDILKSYRD